MENLILLIILAAGTFFDIKTREVPNKLILSGLLISLLVSILSNNYGNIIAATVTFLVLLVVYNINDNILPGGDIKGLVFIVLTKGISFFAVAAYYMLLTAIPILVYLIIKSRKTGEKNVPPLYLNMFLGCIITILGG